MYANGEGVPKDAVQAVTWYRKAAEQGNPRAQFNLGGMYFNGDGAPKDSAQAVVWYRKAAEQGYADAQYNLGVTPKAKAFQKMRFRQLFGFAKRRNKVMLKHNSTWA